MAISAPSRWERYATRRGATAVRSRWLRVCGEKSRDWTQWGMRTGYHDKCTKRDIQGRKSAHMPFVWISVDLWICEVRQDARFTPADKYSSDCAQPLERGDKSKHNFLFIALILPPLPPPPRTSPRSGSPHSGHTLSAPAAPPAFMCCVKGEEGGCRWRCRGGDAGTGKPRGGDLLKVPVFAVILGLSL